MREDMRRWKLIQERLSAEANGREPRPFASRRTLFGIRSSVEEQLDQIAREDEANHLRARGAGAGIAVVDEHDPQRLADAALTGAEGSGLLAP